MADTLAPSACGPTAPCSPPGSRRSAATAPASRSTSAARSSSALVELAEVGSSSTTSAPSAGSTSARSCWSSGCRPGLLPGRHGAVGHCDDLPTYVRAGTLDAFYLRPQPLLLQLVTSDIQLRRLARAARGPAGARASAWRSTTCRGARRAVALLLVALVSGTATFAALFVWAAGPAVLPRQRRRDDQRLRLRRPLRRHAARVGLAPAAHGASSASSSRWPFTAYLPVVTLLGLDTGLGLPGWLGWCAPLAAAWAWAVALVSWRVGVRHYQGAGG